MTPERYQEVCRLFRAVNARPPAERDAFLDAAAPDEAVRAVVRSMLAQDDDPALDLESPVPAGGAGLDGLRAGLVSAKPPPVPDRIGDYVIVGVLGTGGMGIVYRARQERPRRVVALKVLRPGVALSDAGRALRRFEHEAELLGRLAHPGIAQIFEAGTWDAGDGAQPYLVMELVDGQPLLEFARAHELDVRARLALLARICDAVQHAHMSGVIHRDLKPANILVTAEGDPKILDFGIARAVDADVRATTLRTEVGHLLGTIGYMSPEQAAGRVADIDVRCDVYALGVLLFELLAGRLPFDLTERPLTDAIRIIGHEDPVRLRAIDPAFRGDVETIAATALERDRGRRYQSAGAMADDLRAHLEHRPIRARPAGPILRVRKWAQRHPALTATLVIGAAACLALAALYAERTAAARSQRVALAAATLDDATRLAAAYENGREAAAAQETEYTQEIVYQLTRYNTPAELAVLEEREREYLRNRRSRDADYHRALDLLVRAERLGSDAEAAREIRGALYASRYREAVRRRDRFDRQRYLDLVRANDPEGRLAARLSARGDLTIDSIPTGATVHLFRMREQLEVVEDGEPRLVPTPLDAGAAAWPVPPGTWALRVVSGAGALAPGDVIFEVAGRPIRDVVLVSAARPPIVRLDRLVSVDGEPVRGDWEIDHVRASPAGADDPSRVFVFERDGEPFSVEGRDLATLGVVAVEPGTLVSLGDVPIRAWCAGRVVETVAPRGLVVRTTAMPVFRSDATRAGMTPLTLSAVEAGEYLAVLCREGREDALVPVRVDGDVQRSSHAWLPPTGATPPGYVLVQGVTSADPFWMQEHEVTVGEYLEFLNDPETRAEIDASEAPIRVPRYSGLARLARDENDRYVRPANWDERWPIFGVSWDDARAYAQWYTARARAGGRAGGPKGVPARAGEETISLRFDLPTQAEQQAAWVNIFDRPYPFGWTFRPAWVSSNYARPSPSPEPVMRFPIDASVFGVFDLSGSVSEWLDEWWVESTGTRRLVGGSWGHGGPQQQKEMFTVYGYNGTQPEGTAGTLGFRLVARPVEP